MRYTPLLSLLAAASVTYIVTAFMGYLIFRKVYVFVPLVIAWITTQVPGLYAPYLPRANYKGKKVFVTGTTSGIGSSFSQILTEGGAEVIGASRSIASGIKVDLSMDTDVNVFVNECNLQKPDLIVLNAGVGGFGLDSADDNIHLLHLNTDANVRIIKSLRYQPDIIIISSIAADVPMPNMETYCASKAAMSLFFATMSQNWAGNILLVCPGPVETKFYDNELMQKNTVSFARTTFTQRPQAIAELGLRSIGVFSEVYSGLSANMMKLCSIILPRPILTVSSQLVYKVLSIINGK